MQTLETVTTVQIFAGRVPVVSTLLSIVPLKVQKNVCQGLCHPNAQCLIGFPKTF